MMDLVVVGKVNQRTHDYGQQLGHECFVDLIDYLRSVPASALEGAETRDIQVPARDRTLEFKGLPFLQRWAIPNVFFHVTTAYDILRHNGVELGKRDFLNAGREWQ